jgi:hypothetical protein
MRPGEVTLSTEARRWLVGLCLAGLGALFIGLASSPARAWASYLTSAFFFLTLALGGVVLLALLYLSSAGWGVVIKRVAEGIAGYLPVGAASMLAVLLGMTSLYPWAGHGASDPELHAKASYLNGPAFAIRMAAALGLWVVFATLLRRSSLAQDADRAVRHTRRNVALSALFLLTFAWSFSMASFDWIMSLEPHWSSTVFAFYNLSGVLLGGLTATTAATILLRRARLLPEVNEGHLHDLGKLMFGMSTFWAYLWISQYLLIWYANIPEETAYYLARTGHGWGFLFYANVVINWVVPFLMLLPRRAKRSDLSLGRASLVLLLGRWLDVYLMVAPSAQPEHAGIGALEIVMFAGLASLFVLVVTRALASAPLIARGDPYLVESLHHHQ